jgi:hypothetical protein
MSQPNKRGNIIKETEQYIQNKSFDEDFDVLVTEGLEYDPSGKLLRKTTDALTTRIDEVDANTTYIGRAAIGSATSSAVWRIKKIVVSGTVTSILWADGDMNFDNIWDNRTTLTYY